MLAPRGSTIAKRLDEEPNVSEVRCADRDPKAVEELQKTLKKAKGYSVDATRTGEIIKSR